MFINNRFMNTTIIRVLAALIFLSLAPLSKADDFSIVSAQASFSENALSVQARFDLQLSEAVSEALHNGVNIQLLTTLDLFTRRAYVWDKRIARWAFTHQISYHTLTDRYVLTSPQLEGSKSFSSLSDLLEDIGQFNFQSDIIGETLPSSKHGYKLQLRVVLDPSVLPAPLRVMKYISPAWSLRSDIHEWTIETGS